MEFPLHSKSLKLIRIHSRRRWLPLLSRTYRRLASPQVAPSGCASVTMSFTGLDGTQSTITKTC